MGSVDLLFKCILVHLNIVQDKRRFLSGFTSCVTMFKHEVLTRGWYLVFTRGLLRSHTGNCSELPAFFTDTRKNGTLYGIF